jgi:hypothetical protein
MKKVLLAVLALIAVAALWLFAAANGLLGSVEAPGDIHAEERPAAVKKERAAVQAGTSRLLGAPRGKQILFGDFHVHTTFSFDAFMMNMPIAGGPGTHPPADACDFARFCSALDFWSINDHAENLTAELWSKTVDSVRECNAVAGDPSNPDLVTYLGWEWSHIGSTPDNHYGHKNVVLRSTEDDEIPVRPIASRGAATAGGLGVPFAARAALATAGGERGRSFVRLMAEVAGADRCPDGVPVRDLPHGTAWGLYTPAGSDWRKQLPGNDPARQTLVEVYSGHGNSEQLPSWRPVDVAADGSLSCPAPRDGYLPSCWRAGELVEARCKEVGESDAECARRAEVARADYVAAFQAGWKTLPGHPTEAWLDAGQAPDMFQPAFNYRPRGSAQYMLAIRDFSDPERPKRFDFGFIGSSDNHTARPGTGYKEVARGEMTEGRGRRDGASTAGGGGLFGSSNEADEPAASSVPWVSSGESPLQLFEIDRGAAYFVTGGLVAVHSAGRDRDAIWDAAGAHCSGSTSSTARSRSRWARRRPAAKPPASACAPSAPSNRSRAAPSTSSTPSARPVWTTSAGASATTRARSGGQSSASRSFASSRKSPRTSLSTAWSKTPGGRCPAPPTARAAWSSSPTPSFRAPAGTPSTTRAPSRPPTITSAGPTRSAASTTPTASASPSRRAAARRRTRTTASRKPSRARGRRPSS